MKNKESKKNLKVYISLPITGFDVDERKERAMQTEVHLKGLGYDTYNPLGKDWVEGLTYQEYMRIGLEELMKCDVIYMLQGWHLSNGCGVELRVATSIGLEVWFENIELVKL